MSPTLWYWAVEGGEPQSGSEDELIRQLSRGRLPPYVLVWREGWGEWLPAMQVEELAEAFPDVSPVGTRSPRPSSAPGIPPVPISDYPRLRHLAKAAPLGWPDGFEGPEEEIITSEVPEVALQAAAKAMTQPTPPRDLGLREAVERASRLPPERTSRLPERPSRVLDAPQRAPEPEHVTREEDRTPLSKPALPLAAEFGLDKLLDDMAPRRNWALWLRAHGLWLALLVIALGLGAAFALRWLELERFAPRSAAPAAKATVAAAPGQLGAELAPGEGTGASAAAVGASSQALSAGATACTSRRPPVELDDWGVVDIRPLIRSLPGGKAVSLGYAQSHRSATGGRLELESLRLTRQFWQEEDRQIYSVAPLAGAGAPGFHVERQGAGVAFGRALEMTPPQRLGLSEDALVLGPLDQPGTKLWDLPSGIVTSVPEVAANPHGLTVALRVGRNNVGHLRVGLLNAAGQPLSPLVQLGEPQWDFGRPSLASGPEETALVACRRGRGQEPDAIFAAHAHNGQLPRELEPLALPSPAPAELIAPVIAALPDGGFALMWSQGESARRQVRLQRLDSSLAPVGPAFDVTSAGAELGGATAAALHVAGDRLLAFYFVRREEGHSLWVASITCEPPRAAATHP